MRPKQMELTVEQARQLLNYDQESGVITWKENRRPNIKAGKIAGKIVKTGYRVICINGERIFAHRLAWFIHTGAWPIEFIDHINGCRDDNRISNLREATKNINNQNLREANKANKSCGLLGVTWNRGRWTAQIEIPGRGKKNLGRFDDPLLAHQAYVKAKRELHEGCTL